MRVLALFLIGSAAGFAQTALEGMVVNAISGEPLASANVYVNLGRGARPTTETDASGRFHLTVPAGRDYSVMTGLPGYLRNDRQLGHVGSGGISNIRIELCPGAAIAGRVDDEDGFPVEDAFVYLQAYRMSGGERRLARVTYTKTDDLGRFRLANLRPGRYWLGFMSSDLTIWDKRYAAEYFPGAYEFEHARAIDLKPGEEFTADLHFKKQEGVTIAGRVEPAGRSQIFLHGEQPSLQGQGAPSQLDGSFVLRHVPPGKYILSSQLGDESQSPHLFMARQPLTVAQHDVGGMVLQARQVQTMKLRCQVIGAARGSDPPEVTLRPSVESGVPLRERGEADGSSSITGLVPGHYDIVVHQRSPKNNPGSRGIRHAVSAQLGGKEVLQTGFDFDEATIGPLIVTLGSRSTEVRGTLLDAAGRPVAGELLALISRGGVPECAATTEADGSFRAAVWRAGEFRVVSITDDEEWDDPDYLLGHSNEFPPVRVVEGEGVEVNLRLK